MKAKKNLIPKLLLVVAFCIGLLTGCMKEKEDAPEIPPKETMGIDFSDFKVGSKSGIEMDDALKSLMADTTTVNWQYASSTVNFWSFLLGITLAVPVTSFYTSFTHQPEYLGNNKWEWSYDVNYFTSKYTARLTGEKRANDVKWEMYLSMAGIGGFDEFMWFEGTSELDGNSGQWVLYHSAEFPEEVLQLDWKKSGEEIAEVKYTYVRELKDDRTEEPFNGSYLTYGKQAGDYDGYFDIHAYFGWPYFKFLDVDIEWNIDEYYGRVKGEEKYLDTDWHCWENNGYDISCE